jgi:tRNA(adenine34) deaminase
MRTDVGDITLDDQIQMARAIDRAKHAETLGMRPFGCVIVNTDGMVLAESWGSETPTDPTRHSEIIAIQDACRATGGKLLGCTIYSTHEPCVMCCGAIMHAKLSRVIYGSARQDLPSLFRARWIRAHELLEDTSHPPVVGRCQIDECVSLFAKELVT